MSFGDLSRINTNIQSRQALGTLQSTNSELGQRQMRLATGSRLNRAEDDSAAYNISKKLEARVRGQAQAMANVGDAKGMLTVGEGALNTTMDILQTMKEKVVQGANDTMGSEERSAIRSQLNALKDEVGDIFGDTQFNGEKLFTDDSTGKDFTFQVNAENGDTFGVNIGQMSTDSLGLTSSNATLKVAGSNKALEGLTDSNVSATNATTFADGSETQFDFEVTGTSVVSATTTNVSISMNGGGETTVALAGSGSTFSFAANGTTLSVDLSGVSTSDIETGQKFSVHYDDLDMNVRDSDKANTALTAIDSAISKVSGELANLGDSQSRLTFKQDNLQTSMTNNEAARSGIADADFAKEQMEIVKLQILQQTGTSALAQANSAPQSVLSLI